MRIVMPDLFRHPTSSAGIPINFRPFRCRPLDPGLVCLDRRQCEQVFGDMVNGSDHRLGQVDLAQPVVAITDVEATIDVGCA